MYNVIKFGLINLTYRYKRNQIAKLIQGKHSVMTQPSLAPPPLTCAQVKP